MIFVFRKWERFCGDLREMGLQSIPACEVTKDAGSYLVLKHDVETDVARAFQMAQIEKKYGHRGSYYVQAYLLDDEKNIRLLKQMQQMGHEISYHHDVMDSCRGDLAAAACEFERNRRTFEQNGFAVTTVCQHGNPIIERIGYHSNRDFFRDAHIRGLYGDICDIMVNFRDRVPAYLYFSDAGRIFKRIYDPVNNDIVNTDDRNEPYPDLEALLKGLNTESGNIISTHPHRWTSSAALYTMKNTVFRIVKAAAKMLVRVPVMKQFMSKYYYLAKKF